MALIDRHAEASNWRAVTNAIPDRTVNAVKIRMTRKRRELGLEDGRRGEDEDGEWQSKVVIASQKLAEATLRVGRWT